jgi:hypothetical protein
MPIPAAAKAGILKTVGDGKLGMVETFAVSIPRPTNPACMGSCPLPPPETIPTLPAIGASVRIT